MPEDLLIVFESPCLLLWLQLLSKYCKTFRGKKERDRFSGIVYSKSETKNPVSALCQQSNIRLSARKVVRMKTHLI